MNLEHSCHTPVPPNALSYLLCAGGLMLGGPQLQARRDLVDYGYMLLMATVLVSIAYFTSSFGRIILFLAGVTFMFM